MGRGKRNAKLIEADRKEAERKEAEDQMEEIYRRLMEEDKAKPKNNPHNVSTSEGSSGGSPTHDCLPETQNEFRVLFTS